MDAFPLALTLLLVLGLFIYLRVKQKRNYWQHRNAAAIASDSFFFFPNKQHGGIYFQQLYNRYKASGAPFVGCFVGFTPSVLFIDLDLVKRVFISDFDTFPNRGFYHNVRDDPLSLNLVRLEGDNWRRLRAKLTPTFSSGKMKLMFPTKVAIGERLVATLGDLIGSGNVEVEVRDLNARFTTDIIGSIAFGIECNSLADPQTPFRVQGDKAFQCFRLVREQLFARFPRLFQLLHMTAFPKDMIDFYSNIVKETMAMREKQHIRRNDFLDILIELHKTQTEDGEPMLTLNEVIGQVFVFFIGGYETSSSTMGYCLFELSQNQEIQQLARAEVLETLKRFDGVLSYDCLKEMRYLHRVVLETLRKHPIAPILRRVVGKAYQIPDSACTLEEGSYALISVYGIHHDPEFYPQPEKFDPDRFTPDEVQKRHPMTYLPFGAGPRVCVAERFGKMEVMVGIALLLKNFRFSPSPQTPKVIEYDIKEHRIFKVKKLFLNVEKV